MLDNLSLLFRFIAIVENGTLRGAAERLNVTQPALSRSLAMLEKHYGQKLVERRSRGIVPTAFGHKVLSAASRLKRDWEISEDQLHEGETGTIGTLRIQAGPLWRSVVLPGLIAVLQKHFPKLTVRLDNHQVGHAIKDLAEGNIDVSFGGFYIQNLEEQGLEIRRFMQVRDGVVARKNHAIHTMLDAHGRVDMAVLHEFPWLVYSGDPEYEQETYHILAERTGRVPNIRVYVESLTAVQSLLREGDYLCMLPTATAAHMSFPEILPVAVDIGQRRSDSGAIYRSTLKTWPPLVVLLDLCEDYFSLTPVSAHGTDLRL